MQALDSMFESLERDGGVFKPSDFWRDLNRKNVEQLQDQGLENLKRTLATNYFTWVIGWRNDQFGHLARRMRPLDWLRVFRRFPKNDPSTNMEWRGFTQFCAFTRMLHIFAERHDPLDLLQLLSEPDFGSPLPVTLDGRIISQDLINSVLELYAIFEGRSIDFAQPLRICEIGAGYGRNAYVFLSLFPNCTYTVVDIPPALFVSQSYLSEVLPNRRMQKFGQSLKGADVRFVLPQDLATSEPDSFDLVLNISSFHEMKPEQVQAYFDLIDQKLRGRLYTKQWKTWHNRADNLVVSEASYPIKSKWKKIYSRTSLAQPSFFEAVYEV